MDDNFEQLVIDVRATTDGFTADLESMRGALDTSLIDGFDRAGAVLERGLASALRRRRPRLAVDPAIFGRLKREAP